MVEGGRSPAVPPRKMAVRKEAVFGTFHPKCGDSVTLSEDRRTATGDKAGLNFAISSDPIPKGLIFSVKTLQKDDFCVSLISAASRCHTLDAPYKAGSAVHVIHCCLLCNSTIHNII